MLETRGWISLILGIITTAFGAIPLLANFGVIGFNLPFSLVGIILEILLIIGGVFLLIDSAHEDHIKKILSIVIGLLIVALGTLPLLTNFGVIGNVFNLLAVDIAKNIILVVTGVFLIFGSGD